MQLKELRWRIFLTKFWIQVRAWEARKSLNRFLYCSRGWHKVTHDFTEWTISKRKSRVQYLTCKNCGLMMFANAKEKNKYERMKKGWDKKMDELVEKLVKFGPWLMEEADGAKRKRTRVKKA